MMIISGHLTVDPEHRDAIVAAEVVVVEAALAAPGCLDFAITPDSLDPARIRIYERWDNEAQLLVFRGSGPSSEQHEAILDSDVRRYAIAAVGEP